MKKFLFGSVSVLCLVLSACDAANVNGSPVNIETDILAKYVDRLMNFTAAPTLMRDFLTANGF